MMWDRPEYRQVAPGEQISHEFLKQAKPKSVNFRQMGIVKYSEGFMCAYIHILYIFSVLLLSYPLIV